MTRPNSAPTLPPTHGDRNHLMHKQTQRSVTNVKCDGLYIMILVHLLLHPFKRLLLLFFPLRMSLYISVEQLGGNHHVFYHKLPFSTGSLGRIRTEAVVLHTIVH